MRYLSMSHLLGLAGLGRDAPLAVHETARGYVLRGAPGRRAAAAGRPLRLGCWAALASVWALPALAGSAGPVWPQAGASLVALAAGCIAGRRGAHTAPREIEVDTVDRVFRWIGRDARGAHRIESALGFDRVARLVVGQGRLTLVRRGDGARIEIARGDRAALAGLQRRLAADLTPIEARLSGLALRGRSVPRPAPVAVAQPVEDARAPLRLAA